MGNELDTEMQNDAYVGVSGLTRLLVCKTMETKMETGRLSGISGLLGNGKWSPIVAYTTPQIWCFHSLLRSLNTKP